jgi:hypothetical protein
MEKKKITMFESQEQFQEWLWMEELELVDKIDYDENHIFQKWKFIVRFNDKLFSIPVRKKIDEKTLHYNWKNVYQVVECEKTIKIPYYQAIDDKLKFKKDVSEFNKNSVMNGTDTVGVKRKQIKREIVDF